MSNRVELDENQRAALNKYYNRYVEAKNKSDEALVVLSDFCTVMAGVGATLKVDDNGAYLTVPDEEKE